MAPEAAAAAAVSFSPDTSMNNGKNNSKSSKGQDVFAVMTDTKIQGGQEASSETQTCTASPSLSPKISTKDTEAKGGEDKEEDASNSKTMSLYRPSDDDWLSPQLCLVRAQLEVFAATPHDVNERRSAGGSIVPPSVGQVGLRCVHCAHIPLKDRCKGSVLYPKSVRAIHMAMRNFQRHHLLKCKYMPETVRSRYARIKNKSVQSKKDSYIYLAQVCKDMGMMEMGGCLRLVSDASLVAAGTVLTAEPLNKPATPPCQDAQEHLKMGGGAAPHSPEEVAADARRLNNDNVRAASGLLSLFRKTTPASAAHAAAAYARRAGPGPPMNTNPIIPSSLAQQVHAQQQAQAAQAQANVYNANLVPMVAHQIGGLLDQEQLVALRNQLLANNDGSNNNSSTADPPPASATSASASQSIKVLARTDYLRYLTTLNRLSATIQLAQRQAAMLQSYPNDPALQDDYRTALNTMNEEMTGAKIQALRLQEWQMAINNEEMTQQLARTSNSTGTSCSNTLSANANSGGANIIDGNIVQKEQQQVAQLEGQLRDVTA